MHLVDTSNWRSSAVFSPFISSVNIIGQIGVLGLSEEVELTRQVGTLISWKASWSCVPTEDNFKKNLAQNKLGIRINLSFRENGQDNK